MNVFILISIAAFVLGNVFVEWRNEGTYRADGKFMRWHHNALSDYLAGVKYAVIQDAAYCVFGLGLVALGVTHPKHIASTAMIVAGASVFAVVYTALMARANAKRRKDWERLHIVASAGAFGGALIACWSYLHGTPAFWLVVAALASTVGFTFFAKDKTALNEKCLTAFILAGLIAVTVQHT